MTEESVKVAVRVRPFNAREKKRDSKCIIQMSGKTTTIYNPNNKKDSRSFTFDYSYWSHDGEDEDETGYLSPKEGSGYIGQKELFQDIGVEILSNSWHGYNTCLIAYGQTGSGKSWSIFGYGANKGVVPQFCGEMFSDISVKKKDINNNQSYEVFFSMLEIYNERVYDLLSPYWRTRVCKVRQHPKKGFYADGLNEVPVKDVHDIDRRIEQGMKNRTIAETNFNESSSRAHTIIGIKLIQKSTSSSGVETAKTSEINLVDLAGSERVTRGCAEHVKEGAAINQSLSNLGNCIAALVERSEGKDTRIPFRYSVLTKLLKKALSGNSKTIMIAALSPADMNYVETLSTLRYADRAKQIKTKASVNEDPTAKLIRELKEENRRLQKMFTTGSKIGNISGSDLEDGVEEEFAARVAENKRLLNQMDKKWEEKLAEAEEYDREMIELRSKIEEEKKVTPHIYNLSPDPILIGMIVFLLKSDSHTIGRDDQNPKPYIPLKGVNILKNHGEIKKTGGSFRISKHADSRILVNGVPLTGDAELHHYDRILIGTAHLYIFSNPEEGKRLQTEGKKIVTPSYEDALEEMVIKSGVDGTKIPDILRKMIDFLPHLNEANGLSEELDKKVQYEPIIITPAVKELILLNEDEDLFCKATQLQTGHTWFWSRDKLLTQKFQMQEMFLKFQNNEKWDVTKDGDPFIDPIEANCLVGVTQVFIKSIAYLLNITVKSPLIDYRGLKVGELEVSILSRKCDGVEVTSGENVMKDNPMEIRGKTIDFSINISQGWIPHKYIDVFCQYSIFTDDEICTNIVSAKTQNIVFDHSKDLSIEVFDNDVLDFILNKSIIIEVWGKQLPGRYKPFNQAAKLGKSTRQIMKEAELLGKHTSIKPKVSIDEFKTLSNYSLIDKRHEYLTQKLARIEELCQTKESEGENSVPILDIQLLLSPKKSASLMNSTAIDDDDDDDRSDVTELSVSAISESNEGDDIKNIENGNGGDVENEDEDHVDENGERLEDPLEGLEEEEVGEEDDLDVTRDDIAVVVNTSRASNTSGYFNDSGDDSGGSCFCVLI